MLRFDVITILPQIFDSYLKESLISRGQKKKLIEINIHNLRDWADDPHRTVDDRPFGGGLGMVMKVEPIYRAIHTLKSQNQKKKKKTKTKVILFSPRGKKFTQKVAYQLSKADRIIMICGRYEGVDERVAKNIADIELSVGDFVLMGGEIPAMAVIETVSRLVPGVIGKEQLLGERITKEKGFTEYIQYTRPEIFETKEGKKWKTPKVLLSGDHKKIQEWRKNHSKDIGN